jgi:hypothetical protein
MEQIQPYKWIIIIGFVLIITGIAWWLLADKLFWIGKLPGDFRLDGTRFRFYFPLTTMLLFSALINLVIWLIRKFFM